MGVALTVANGRRIHEALPGFSVNPIAIVLLKTASYSAFGFVASRRSEKAMNPVGFGVARVVAGWVVGLPLLLAAGGLADRGWDKTTLLLVMALPRAIVWAVLLRGCYRPIGGRSALLGWSLAGAALSTATDVIVFCVFRNVAWLRFSMC